MSGNNPIRMSFVNGFLLCLFLCAVLYFGNQIMNKSEPVGNSDAVILQKQHLTIVDNEDKIIKQLNQIVNNQGIQDANMRVICGTE